ncbi:sugar phosphate isomerase/epimerase family protein [Actinacidiphila soli]|uniref:sugar phosphate isomerase/epimerase family protein n=1 Tax=Actinacidiphila soli TaxID=2487275 RepID=UPI0013E343AF|nr:sugar phosphate isomerase/epimerase family protein [Actinacidiphila soli]
MNTLSASSYSIREQLGPLVFDFTDPQGNDVHFELPYPKLLRVSEFPARARDVLGVEAVETVAFQFNGVDDPEIDAFAEALASNGIRLVNACIDAGDLLGADEAKRAADIELNKRWIERFAALSPQFVRVNPSSPFNPHQPTTVPAHLVDTLGELGAFAKEHGTRLLVENHGGRSSDPVWMRSLLVAVGRDACGLLLDLGNFDAIMGPTTAAFLDGASEAGDPADVYAGIDLTSVYDGIEALADRAELVSLKAHYVTQDGAIGPVDLKRALGILLEHGYTGPLSLEYEGHGGDPWAKSAAILDLAKSVLGKEDI